MVTPGTAVTAVAYWLFNLCRNSTITEDDSGHVHAFGETILTRARKNILKDLVAHMVLIDYPLNSWK